MDSIGIHGYGEEILGLLEYQKWGPVNRIHWHSSAKDEKWRVIQLNRFIQTEVAVIADLTRRSRYGLGTESTTEMIINTATLVLTRCFECRHQSSLGLIQNEPMFLPKGQGLSHLHLVLDQLAVVSPSGEDCFRELAQPRARMLHRGSRAVFITVAAGIDSDLLRSLIDHLVREEVYVDVFLIDENRYTRIYRDQGFKRPSDTGNFHEICRWLSIRGVRVFPSLQDQKEIPMNSNLTDPATL
jgi:uncharacterized protein (DUF58 family)